MAATEDVAGLLEDPLIFGDFDGMEGLTPPNATTTLSQLTNDVNDLMHQAAHKFQRLDTVISNVEDKVDPLDRSINELATKMGEHAADNAQKHRTLFSTLGLIIERLYQVAAVQVGEEGGHEWKHVNITAIFCQWPSAGLTSLTLSSRPCNNNNNISVLYAKNKSGHHEQRPHT